jgi:undecaprenyl-phosphate galactose phosphotransferase
MAAASPHRLGALLRQYRAKCLFIAAAGADELTQQVVECALQERVRFAIMMQPYPASTFALKPKSFFSHDTVLFSPQDGLSNPISRAIKSCMDILVALLALIATAPLLLVISVTNLLDGGPILFRQQRVGAGGRPFYCLKFRTMVVDADTVLQAALAESPELAAEWAARRKLANDPRITRFGRFLRKTSLDELPQLINVLRRDMSLVGPRPIVENEIAFYGEHIAQYYATRPGLTGLWQVSGRSNTSYARRVQLDVWYVNNWTIWHDIAVLLKTIPAVFGREGAF